MLTVKAITKLEVAEFFKNDPKLCLLGLADESLESIYYGNTYNPGESTLLGLFDIDNNLVCVLKYEMLTNISIKIHAYIGSCYKCKELIDLCKDIFVDYFKQTELQKLYFMVPSSCFHVINTLERWGLCQEGVLTKAIKWRYKVQDLYIYSLDLKR